MSLWACGVASLAPCRVQADHPECMPHSGDLRPIPMCFPLGLTIFEPCVPCVLLHVPVPPPPAASPCPVVSWGLVSSEPWTTSLA